MSRAVVEWTKRGVRIYSTCFSSARLRQMSSSVSAREASVSSRRLSGALRSMFTLPMRADSPARSVSSISRQAASLWMVAKAEKRRVPLAHIRLRNRFHAASAKSASP